MRAGLISVQPDADFECIAVMMEHTQDVKTIAWHPKEEVCDGPLASDTDEVALAVLQSSTSAE